MLQYHLHMSYSDIRSMPIRYRRWFIERLAQEFKQKAETMKKSRDKSKGLRDIPMGEMSEMMQQAESIDQGAPRKFK